MMDKIDILVRLRTAIFALKEAESVAIAGGENGHAVRIGEVRFLLEQLYAEIKKPENR